MKELIQERGSLQMSCNVNEVWKISTQFFFYFLKASLRKPLKTSLKWVTVHYGQSISLVFRDAIGSVQHTKACCAWETQISNCNKEDIDVRLPRA